jgi:hypothetical protein
MMYSTANLVIFHYLLYNMIVNIAYTKIYLFTKLKSSRHKNVTMDIYVFRFWSYSLRVNL